MGWIDYGLCMSSQSRSHRPGSCIPLQPEPCRGSFHSFRDVSHSIYRLAPFEEIMILADIAKLIRSKNAGPFTLTFDIMFADLVSYRRVKDSGALNPAVF